MFGFIKRYIQKKIIGTIYSEQTGLKQYIYDTGRDHNYRSLIESFRNKYDIHETFRFNGNFILFYGEGKIVAGKNSYVSDYSMLQAFNGCTISIGEGCSISSNVRIFTQTNFADDDFSKSKRDKIGNVIIGKHVWIGANVVINPGITLGDNCVIGANSVVTKDVPVNAIYGGVPAKLIRMKEKI